MIDPKKPTLRYIVGAAPALLMNFCVALVLFHAVTLHGAEEEESITQVNEVSYPETLPLLQNVRAREFTPLNGDWNIVMDRIGRGFADYFGAPWYRNHRPETGMELIEYSFDERNQLRVPGDWNTQRPELLFYDRAVWYQREFESDPRPGSRYFLQFGGANYRCDVNLNGKRLGRHDGGYTAFSVEITDVIRPGTNDLVVRVDARLDENSVPTESIDWWPYGGLIRDVLLVRTPGTFIRDYQVSLQDHDAGGIDVWVVLDGASSSQPVAVSIPELGIDSTATADASGRAEFEIEILPDLWSPDHPKLYDVEIATGEDRILDRIGFRTIAVHDGEILLNGKPVFLRGISSHEESILKPGVAYDEADAKAMFDLASELGANFVRLAHYPHNEYTVRKADQRGILLWSEVPVYWDIAWENPETLEIARRQVSEMIGRDRNRAAVIIWSVANETPNSRSRYDFLKVLIETARTEDPTRLISAALLGDVRSYLQSTVPRLLAHNRPEGAPTPRPPLKFSIEDPLGELVDLVAINQYFGWYYSSPVSSFLPFDEGKTRELILKAMPEFRFTTPYGKPIVISEFGAGAKAGFHSERALLWSEEYQAQVYAQQILMLGASEQVRGMSPWILKDFRSTMRPLNGIQDFYNRKGLVDPSGRKKLAFDVLRDYYSEHSDGGPAAEDTP